MDIFNRLHSKINTIAIHLLTCLCLVLSAPVKAQTEKGNFLIGSQTNLAYSSTHSKL
jgi:hypothetical protein